MIRPSPLYRRLGLTGYADELLTANIAGEYYAPRLHSVSIARGSQEISHRAPSTANVSVRGNVPLAHEGTMHLALSERAQTLIASATGMSASSMRDRFVGRTAKQTAHDTPRGRTRADVVGVSWSSMLSRHPAKWSPSTGHLLIPAAPLWTAPSWAPALTLTRVGGSPETWAGPEQNVTADDWLNLLVSHGYVLAERRSGTLAIVSLTGLKQTAAAAASTSWPLARAHVLSPSTWEQPVETPVEYRITYKDAAGVAKTTVTAPDGVPTGTAPVEDLDWTRTRQADDTQWRRVLGYRRNAQVWNWRLPSLTVRLDHLIASPYTAHRRAAGQLLALDVGDWVPLAGDWPAGIAGLHMATSITEDITPDAWTLTLGLQPFVTLDGNPSPPIAPRTWNQAGSRTWDSAGTNTWNQGVPA